LKNFETLTRNIRPKKRATERRCDLLASLITLPELKRRDQRTRKKNYLAQGGLKGLIFSVARRDRSKGRGSGGKNPANGKFPPPSPSFWNAGRSKLEASGGYRGNRTL